MTNPHRETMRILIVEDDPLLGSGLVIGLGQDGYRAEHVMAADPAEQAVRAGHFDAMVLDLGLPGRDGLGLLRDLRRQGVDLPVIILTARDAIAEKIAGLDAGADDYLVKPFDLDELSARIRALLRRQTSHCTPLFRAGELTLDTIRRVVMLGARPLTLPPREYALLEPLIASADRVVSRAHLQASLYGWGDEVESNALEVHIHNLRQKLGKTRILTVRGIGYCLVSAPPQ